MPPYTVQDVLNGTVRGRTNVLCPFHEDENPSATVYEDLSFKCFSCGTSYQFRQLIAILLFGSDDPESMGLANAFIAHGGLKGLTASIGEAKRVHIEPTFVTYCVLQAFWEFSRDALAANKPMIAMIQESRGIQNPRLMGLGLADSSIPFKIVESLQSSIPFEAIAEALMETGICYRLKPGIHDLRPVHQRFRLSRHQLIITDWEIIGSGRKVIFYQARATAETPVKYLCPPGFQKSLFGSHSLVSPTSHIWLCEGPFDILPLIEAGQSAVAVTGSDLKPSHVQALADATNGREILIAFDRDDAGQMKAPIILSTLQSHGLKARIIVPPPPYKDMGEWATAEGVTNILTEIEWG